MSGIYYYVDDIDTKSSNRSYITNVSMNEMTSTTQKEMEMDHTEYLTVNKDFIRSRRLRCNIHQRPQSFPIPTSQSGADDQK